MPKYYLNKKTQDDVIQEIHQLKCKKLPIEEDRIYLGEFMSCMGAIREAKRYYRRVNACYHCSQECYTSKKNRE